jgi:hypothetical protein
MAAANRSSNNVSVLMNNRGPSAAADHYTTEEDTVLRVAVPRVLANDAGLDGDRLSATLVSGPTHGSLSLKADGSFTYAPAADFNGSDAFSYRAGDGDADSGVVTVAITVRPPAPPPPPPRAQPLDTQAPSAPSPLRGRLVAGPATFVRTVLELAWAAASDNIGVTSYLLHRSGTSPLSERLAASAGSTRIALRSAATVTLVALDAAGNRSQEAG